jgi:Ni,Fe-hydrogenase III large subunit
VSRFDWMAEYLPRLEGERVVVRSGSARTLAPAHWLNLDHEDWGRAAELAAAMGLRWAGLWGDHRGSSLVVHACLEYQGDYLVLGTEVPADRPELRSHTPFYPAADRMERHAADLLGLRFDGHPDPRRWTRHQAWPEEAHPLHPDFPVQGEPRGQTPPDADYPFRKIQGAGVYEIPVGPVHAGIIEPGHFRFHAAGEPILSLEERLGYVHKGIEKIAVGRDGDALVRLAGRVSGDSTVAHAWAACQALERATGCRVPERALVLRALLCERERVANHLGDIGAICNDVGFPFAQMQCSALREQWQRRSAELFGHRLLMDRIIPGGVVCDLDAAGMQRLGTDHRALRQVTGSLFDLLDDLPSLADRLFSTGRLSPETARRLGAPGYVGRASGQGFDLRTAGPYAPYDRFPVEVPVFETGDVAARMQVRQEEIRIGLELMDRLLAGLPEGPVREPLPEPGCGCEGLGMVEGWRGEILSYVRLDDTGRVARFFPRDPSWLTWPALENIVLGNIVPDFPVCNKSVNGSYSGQDL